MVDPLAFSPLPFLVDLVDLECFRVLSLPGSPYLTLLLLKTILYPARAKSV
jgi:hypothetical protein